jgi:hypothetical protein
MDNPAPTALSGYGLFKVYIAGDPDAVARRRGYNATVLQHHRPVGGHARGMDKPAPPALWAQPALGLNHYPSDLIPVQPCQQRQGRGRSPFI